MFPAHIAADGTPQSVEQHLFDTARYAKDFGAKLGLCSAAQLCALVHDVGKLSAAFGAYLRFAAANPDAQYHGRRPPHAAAGARWFAELAGAATGYRGVLVQFVTAAVLGHHTGLYDVVSPDGSQPMHDKIAEDEVDYAEIKRNADAVVLPDGMRLVDEIQRLLPLAEDELKTLSAHMGAADTNRHFHFHLVQKFLLSCLVDADHSDTARIMLGSEVSDSPPPCKKWLSLLDARLSAFTGEREIDRLRDEISSACAAGAVQRAGIRRLTVPTGGGKTLSALRYALLHGETFGKRRIIYVAPYLSIIDQNAAVFRDTLGTDADILECHSAVAEQYKDEERYHNEHYRFLSGRWDSPFIVTTMVQFFEVLFGRRTSQLKKLHQLADAVVIFDEVQSVPPKMIHIMNYTLNFLTRVMGAEVVLCSATQPPFWSTVRKLMVPQNAELVSDYARYYDALRRVRVVNAMTPSGRTHDELARFALERLREDALDSCLLVVNTKRDAALLYRAIAALNDPLEEPFTLYHLSTGMCRAHRDDLFREMTETLKTGRVICVSTQLIEAGVDISFACAMRALAGLDSVMQTFGRLNRNGEFGVSKGYIVNLKTENLRMLKDIKMARDAAAAVLYELSDGDDLLSPDVIARYYARYFDHYVKNVMDYPVSRPGEAAMTLFDLLSENKVGVGALRGMGQAPRCLFNFAFRTAGERYDLIESETVPVLVPYKDGAGILERLRGGAHTPKELQHLLKAAQKYTINLYPWQFKALGAAGLAPVSGGLFALREPYYHHAVGLNTDGGEPELLIG